MKKLFLTTATLLIAATGFAYGADLPPPPMYRPLPPPPPIFTWTGCYVGAGGGYGLWTQDTSGTSKGVTNTQTWTNGGKGWFGTGQLGCDYQWSPRIVLGVFADGDLDSLSSTARFAPGLANEKESSSWAIGARAGWLVTPGLLGYASGGFTEAHFNGLNYFAVGSGAPLATSSPAHTYDGWFLGTGYEYALDFVPFPGLFWKTEYRYSSYQSDNLPITGGAAGAGINTQKSVQTIRTELVWRFNFLNFAP